jgi:Na+/proline symporter
MKQISPSSILAVIVLHLLLIMVISYFTSRKANNASFFIAGRKAPWWLVTWGVIGAVISGITFISVPGAVGVRGGNEHFSYFQLILGNSVGYIIIALVLLPTFYKMKLVSIYGYLEQRFGGTAMKIGAACFTVSRVFGSSLRLFLMALVLQKFVLAHYGIPFWVTAIIVPGLIWLYTFKGGTKTIIVTDSIQTALFILAIIMTIYDIAGHMNTNVGGLVSTIWSSEYSETFYFGDFSDPNNFTKQFFGGILVAIGTSGLDQDVMQKHLSCKNLKESQKNVFTSTAALIVVNLLFLILGAGLYLLAKQQNVTLPERADEMYPLMAFNHLSVQTGIIFIMGLVACSYSSADSALTALTTSFCVDFLGFEKRKEIVSEEKLGKQRKLVHLGFTVAFMLIIILMNVLGNESILNVLFKFTGYLYGPLIGLFSFGFLTRYEIKEKGIAYVCILAVAATVLLDYAVPLLFDGFQLGLYIWGINGILAFTGLYLIRK